MLDQVYGRRVIPLRADSAAPTFTGDAYRSGITDSVDQVGKYKIREYGLTGPTSQRAEERGLMNADWYPPDLPREVTRDLVTRRDGLATRDTAISSRASLRPFSCGRISGRNASSRPAICGAV